MKMVRNILALVFGLIGLTYAIIGGAVLYTGISPVLGYVFLPLGLLFLLAAGCVWMFLSRSLRRREELLTWGTRATATVTEVQSNLNLRLNGYHPKIVLARCVHPITHETLTLRSHNVANCTLQPGQTVEIAFDPMNEKHYVFDLMEERA